MVNSNVSRPGLALGDSPSSSLSLLGDSCWFCGSLQSIFETTSLSLLRTFFFIAKFSLPGLVEEETCLFCLTLVQLVRQNKVGGIRVLDQCVFDGIIASNLV